METDELKKIWHILAENKLIDKDLAKENILQIISKKGNGIINKMKRKSKIDYFIYLSGLIFIPLVTMAVQVNLQHPFPSIRSYIGLSFVELFFIYMFGNSVKILKFLDYSSNTTSIKEALLKVKSYFEAYLKKAYWVSFLFGLSFLIFSLLHFLIILGGINHFTFSSMGFLGFISYFSILLLVLIIAWPFILKIEHNTKFSGLLKDIDHTIDDLNKAE
jgi:hypothetical protein